MNYYIKITSPNKAKNDIDNIVEHMGYKNLSGADKSGSVARFMSKVRGVMNILFSVKRGDMLFLQYPMKKFYKIACSFAHFKGAKVITVIHDLGTFRRHKLTAEQEIKLLSGSDVLIVHNGEMEKWLAEHGYKNKMVQLGIFDYLSDCQAPEHTHKTNWKVIFAGGLGPQRRKFMEHLEEHMDGWDLDLYGPHMTAEDAKIWTKIKYNGLRKPDELISQNDGDFGLVWDGESMDECNGDWGSYLLVNNPHKTSFTYRCGMPVIIWAKAAMAKFITENRAGIAIESLRDLSEKLKGLSQEDYAKMKNNATEIGKQVGEGHYIRTALATSIAYLGENK